MSAVIAFPRPKADAFTTALALVRDLTRPAPANVVHVRNPQKLAKVLQAIHARACAIDASDADVARARRVAFAELDAGRSTATVIALATSELTGRRNALLRPVPA